MLGYFSVFRDPLHSLRLPSKIYGRQVGNIQWLIVDTQDPSMSPLMQGRTFSVAGRSRKSEVRPRLAGKRRTIGAA
jgi:hypothetical protein